MKSKLLIPEIVPSALIPRRETRFPPKRLRIQDVLERSEFHDGKRIMKRHQFKLGQALRVRLIKEARLAREKAERLPRGEERETLLKKAREADITALLDEWFRAEIGFPKMTWEQRRKIVVPF